MADQHYKIKDEPGKYSLLDVFGQDDFIDDDSGITVN